MHYSKEEKAMWLEDWKQSGKSAWSYARENGIKPQTFTNWAKPRRKNKQTLVEIPTGVFQSARLTQEILIEKGEVKIHIPLEPLLGELHTIIKNIGQSL
jgi:transposase-like protein